MLPRRFCLDSIFDDFMDNGEGLDMKVDIYEKENSYHIVSDIPGVKKEDIMLDFSDGYLTITAEKKEEKEENDKKKFIRKERFYGKSSRKFYVGNINEEEIKAEFRDGVLAIDVPKERKEKNKKVIDIM